jgi:hypothetical protein
MKENSAIFYLRMLSEPINGRPAAMISGFDREEFWSLRGALEATANLLRDLIVAPVHPLGVTLVDLAARLVWCGPLRHQSQAARASSG